MGGLGVRRGDGWDISRFFTLSSHYPVVRNTCISFFFFSSFFLTFPLNLSSDPSARLTCWIVLWIPLGGQIEDDRQGEDWRTGVPKSIVGVWSFSVKHEST